LAEVELTEEELNDQVELRPVASELLCPVV